MPSRAVARRGIRVGGGGLLSGRDPPGLYTLEAGQTATGSILDWYRRHFAGGQQAEAEQRKVPVFTVLDELAAAVPPGSEGLIVRDDWQGNRSPYKNPAARGASPDFRWRTVPAISSGRSMKRRPAAPGTSSRTRRPMAFASSAFFWAAACPFAPLAADPRGYPQETHSDPTREGIRAARLGHGGRTRRRGVWRL